MEDDGLTPEVLLQAYAEGVFPMAESRDDAEVFWVDPRRRGVIPLDGFRVSRSLARRMRRPDYRVTFDTAFEAVIDGCAERPETWINARIRDLSLKLHSTGDAHSVEVWQDDALAGGLYGVALRGAFFAESMFSRRRDASKIALAYMIDRLRGAGFSLFDVQFLTPHLASLGAIEIPRADYRQRLSEALALAAIFPRDPRAPGPQETLQRITQTS